MRSASSMRIQSSSRSVSISTLTRTSKWTRKRKSSLPSRRRSRRQSHPNRSRNPPCRPQRSQRRRRRHPHHLHHLPWPLPLPKSSMTPSLHSPRSSQSPSHPVPRSHCAMLIHFASSTSLKRKSSCSVLTSTRIRTSRSWRRERRPMRKNSQIMSMRSIKSLLHPSLNSHQRLQRHPRVLHLLHRRAHSHPRAVHQRALHQKEKIHACPISQSLTSG